MSDSTRTESRMRYRFRAKSQADLHRVLISARAALWHATVQDTGAGFSWDIRMTNEEAAARLWPVVAEPGDVYTMAWYRARLPEDCPRADDVATRALRSGASHYEQEFRIRLASGECRWIAEDVQIESLGARRWRLVGVCTDITERKDAEALLALQHDKDRRIADVWHQSMLHHVAEGAYQGLDVKTFYVAALEESLVGGDFFDSLKLDENRVAVAVGDVSGKGLAAAVYTAEIKYALRAFLFAGPDVGAAVAALNNLICNAPRGPDEEIPMASLVVAVIDRVSGCIFIANAGADPPVIIRANGVSELCGGGGLILGVAAGAVYPVLSATLMPGDTLLMVTDGITEARQGSEFFGLEGVAHAALSAGVSASLADMGQSVLDAARAHHGGLLGDDICLLLVRRP